MHPLVEIALINAVLASLLAVLAAVVGWWFRRPALTHALWLLVLIRLVTPPLWRVPLLERDWLSLPMTQFNAIIESSLTAPHPMPELSDLPSDPMESPSVARVRPKVLPAARSDISNWPRMWTRFALTWLRSEDGQKIAVNCLLAVWGLGSVLWFSIQAWRCVLFQAAMSRGHEASAAVQQQLAQLAARSGGAPPPQIWLMPGVLSPMLWSVGYSTRLIFPQLLFERMTSECRETLLAHELAHFQRRDHWVRFVSLFVTGLFWWHPVVWWARHMLEAAEEECCDAWVVTRGATPPRRYAEAILETVDFIAERSCRVPPLGTGLGQLPFLRQRLIWIMRGPRRQDFSRLGRICCAAMAIGLPIQPTWLIARPVDPLAELRHNDTRFEGGDVLESQHSDIAIPNTDDQSQETPTRIATKQWQRHPGEIAVESPDRRFVGLIGTARQWLVDQTGERVLDLSQHKVRAATFTPDGLSFVTGGLDGVVRLWDAETFSERNLWQGSHSPIHSVAVSSDLKWIASGSRDGIVRMWQLGVPGLRELPREAVSVSCVRFSADGRLMAVTTGDASQSSKGRIVVWNTDDWTEHTSMNWNQPTSAVSFGRDGQSLFSGDWQGRIARWNVNTGELLGFVEGQQTVIAAAEVSPESSRLADTRVPELPLNLLVGDAVQDEKVKSLWDQLTQRATLFKRPVSNKRPIRSPMDATSL